MIAIDSLERSFKIGVDWSFGGATAMRLFYDHRESKDIDIFVTDPYAISGLSPRLNDVTERLTGDYNEQSNFLKLKFPEGEVDFVVAARLVEDVPFVRRSLRGRDVNVEAPIEIVAKKCFYRADAFTARDIFDLAVLLEEEPENVERHASLLLAKHVDLERRLGMMRVAADADQAAIARAERARQQVQDGLDAVAARPDFIRVKESAIDRVLTFLQDHSVPNYIP